MFQTVLFSAEGVSTIGFGLGETGEPVLLVRGVSLLLDPTGDAPSILFDMSAAPKLPSLGPLFAGLDPTRGVDAAEQFFLATVKDLDLKLANASPYELIRAAALLRQLLLDGFLNRVTRKYRTRVRFRVFDPASVAQLRSSLDQLTVGASWWNPDPSLLPNNSQNVVDMKLDEFLATEILTWKSQRATVKDVIRACANAKGGVHFGDADNPREQLILDFDDANAGDTKEMSVSALAGICRAALKALAPVVEAILAQRQQP
jgi:hypothetical protein